VFHSKICLIAVIIFLRWEPFAWSQEQASRNLKGLSLKKETLLRFLAQDFHNSAYDPVRSTAQSGAGAGLGLHGIHQAGLSLLFASAPGERTEVMIFFSMLASYKDFRSGFRFLSVLTS
jgi:hypothetical protein